MLKTVFYFILCLFFASCIKDKDTTQQDFSTTVEKQCVVYKLDKRYYTDTDTLIYKVFVHQMYDKKYGYTVEELQTMVDSLKGCLTAERIDIKIIGTNVGSYWIEHHMLDTAELLPIKKINVLNFEVFTELNKRTALNVYIVPDDSGEYRGNATADVPNTNCAVQRQYIEESFIHELSHSMGCLHTHEEDHTDGLNNTYGDKVADTHSSPVLNSQIVNCMYQIPGLTPIESFTLMTNVMSYSNPVCRRTLTCCQGARLRKMPEYNPFLKKCLDIKSAE